MENQNIKWNEKEIRTMHQQGLNTRSYGYRRYNMKLKQNNHQAKYRTQDQQVQGASNIKQTGKSKQRSLGIEQMQGRMQARLINETLPFGSSEVTSGK